ncbi:MAG: SpoIIE family protein phosphatase [Ignavibacteria bacterium]|nr:SpoIIE family protein phosphatase [Ignavibacteria bacterium]
MAQGYTHVEIEYSQMSKKPGRPCGDVIDFFRDENSTVIFFADGLGSGIKANIAATMCTSRLKELHKGGFSLRQAFNSVLNTMEDAKVSGMPYAVFTVMKISTEGITTILSYEMPPPMFFSKRNSSVLQQRIFTVDNSIIGESNCFLHPAEGIVLVSDGLINAGMGKSLKAGWKIEGVNDFINKELSTGVSFKSLPEIINYRAKKLWDGALYDDCSVIFANCIKGKTINLLTGPPVNPDDDANVVSEFMSMDGLKIICGGSTAKIVARQIDKKLIIDDDFQSEMTPPSYTIDGIDLVTEGAVTLNQVYNIWGEEHKRLEKFNPVTELYILLAAVDRVNFFVGKSKNPAVESINFTQRGILSREKIVSLLADKLKADGKLVTLTEF